MDRHKYKDIIQSKGGKEWNIFQPKKERGNNK